jgi:hypothetical protein
LKSIIELRRELRQCVADHENLIHGIEELMTLGAPVLDIEELRVGLFQLKKVGALALWKGGGVSETFDVGK